MSRIIKLENICKEYELGSQVLRVLNNINLDINQGEFVSIMGQSGSGKSTLMNIIGMLDIPSSGKYLFNDEDVSYLSDDDQALIRRKSIGFIFQTYNLLPRISAMKQVMLPLMYQGIRRKEREQRAIEVLTKVGLADKIYNLPTEMSGGQQQRVAIARALICEPPLLLGDEPTGALDSKTGNEIMELLCKLNQEEGKTILIITHSSEVDNFAKRHIKIKDGNIF